MTAPRTLTVGVVGCGGAARYQHVPAIEALEGVELAWVCDRDREAAAALGRECGVPHYAEFETAMDAPPDAVHVCTPHHAHADLAVAALRGGSHVLVEKPMAASVADCDRMADAAAETGRKLCVAHSNRFRAGVRSVFDAATAGEYGDVVGVASFVGREVEWDVSRPWVADLPTGPLGEHRPPGIDRVPALLGAGDHAAAVGRDADEVTGVGVQVAGDGTLGSVQAMRRTPPTKTVQVFGTEKRAFVDVYNYAAVEYDPREPSNAAVIADNVDAAAQLLADTARSRLRYATHETTGAGEFAAPGHYPLIERFARSVREGGPVPVTPEQGTRVVRVLEAVREATDDGRQHSDP
jgi:predicted dehydrogenase